MRLTIQNDVLTVERPYQKSVDLQRLTDEEKYQALLVYGVPEHIAAAVTHKLITYRVSGTLQRS